MRQGSRRLRIWACFRLEQAAADVAKHCCREPEVRTISRRVLLRDSVTREKRPPVALDAISHLSTGRSDVRTGLTGILLAGIAIASLALGASPVGSYAQTPGQGDARNAPNRADPRGAVQTHRPAATP